MDERTPKVLQTVDQWNPGDDSGKRAKERMLAFLSSTDQPFSREAQPAHVTGGAVVLSTAGVLMHKHKLAGVWFGPGGHVDPGEWPWDAAERETFEETGIKAWGPSPEPYLARMDVHDTVNGHIHYDLTYFLVAMPDEPAPPPGESQDVRWFSLEEALAQEDHYHRLALRSVLAEQVELPR